MLTSLEDLIEAIMGRKEEVASKLFTYIHTDSKFSFVPAFYVCISGFLFYSLVWDFSRKQRKTSRLVFVFLVWKGVGKIFLVGEALHGSDRWMDGWNIIYERVVITPV